MEPTYRPLPQEAHPDNRIKALRIIIILGSIIAAIVLTIQ